MRVPRGLDLHGPSFGDPLKFKKDEKRNPRALDCTSCSTNTYLDAPTFPNLRPTPDRKIKPRAFSMYCGYNVLIAPTWTCY